MDSAIVLSADVLEIEQLDNLVEQARGIPEIEAIKVGKMLALRYGLVRVVESIVTVLPQMEVIYDHQKAGTDIPAMGRNFADACALGGVDKAILFPHAGPKTLKAYVKALREVGVVPLVGLAMTHEAYFASEGGWIDDTAPGRILSVAVDMGVTRFVLPGNKPARVKAGADAIKDLGVNATIYMPGIGTQGGDLVEACRVTRPHKARPIIGSAIYKADDPRAKMLEFASQLRGE